MKPSLAAVLPVLGLFPLLSVGSAAASSEAQYLEICREKRPECFTTFRKFFAGYYLGYVTDIKRRGEEVIDAEIMQRNRCIRAFWNVDYDAMADIVVNSKHKVIPDSRHGVFRWDDTWMLMNIARTECEETGEAPK